MLTNEQRYETTMEDLAKFAGELVIIERDLSDNHRIDNSIGRFVTERKIESINVLLKDLNAKLAEHKERWRKGSETPQPNQTAFGNSSKAF